MPSTRSIFLTLLPIVASTLTVVSAASAPTLAGCLASGSIPTDAVNSYTPTSAISCASSCWSKGEYSNSYFDLTKSFPCYCSHESALPSAFVQSSAADYAENECSASQITYYTTTNQNQEQTGLEMHLARKRQHSQSLKERFPRTQLQARKKTASAECPTPLSACKTSDGSSYQCIDTNLELESCGGCIHGDYDDGSATSAVDCTTLAGVASGGVACHRGICKAYRCVDGYKISNHTCIAK